MEKTINNYHLAYETYGSLNEKKDNAILVFHALSGDQFASGTNPITNKSGWWSYAVGPDKAINTNKILCNMCKCNWRMYGNHMVLVALIL